jgi:hypothetical protein
MSCSIRLFFCQGKFDDLPEDHVFFINFTAALHRQHHEAFFTVPLNALEHLVKFQDIEDALALLEEAPLIGSYRDRVGIVFRGEFQVITELFDILPFLEDCAIDIKAPEVSDNEVIFLSVRAMFAPKAVNPTLDVAPIEEVTFFTSSDGKSFQALACSPPPSSVTAQITSVAVPISTPPASTPSQTAKNSQPDRVQNVNSSSLQPAAGSLVFTPTPNPFTSNEKAAAPKSSTSQSKGNHDKHSKDSDAVIDAQQPESSMSSGRRISARLNTSAPNEAVNPSSDRDKTRSIVDIKSTNPIVTTNFTEIPDYSEEVLNESNHSQSWDLEKAKGPKFQ